MILVDTSIWVDHLHHVDAELEALLEAGRVLCHPFVIGEVALDHLKQRNRVLTDLQDLTQAVVADGAEVLILIIRASLFGSGIGYVDAHLLAAVKMTPGASLWTRDKQLLLAANRLGLAF